MTSHVQWFPGDRLRLALLFLVAVLTVPLLGGSFRPLAVLQLRSAWLLALAFVSQVLILLVFSSQASALHSAVHIASYLPALWFLWLNRHITPLWVVGLGALMNLAAIVTNGGVLPSDPDALRRAGIALSGEGFLKSRVLEDPALPWLGDWIVVPPPLPRGVASPGDIVLFLGALATLHWLCGSWLFPGRRRELARLWASRSGQA